ncbi:MAG: FHA domain-containing protein [Myxococcales bacterium]|nr:FHA domain-containing protein [Myxococcales bacterium]
MAFKFRLIANSGILKGKEFEFDKREVTIGQASINSLVINDPDIDPYHAQIRVLKGKLLIEDLKSELGVRLNAIDVDEGELSSGDELILGDNSFTIIFDEAELKRQATSFFSWLTAGFGREEHQTEYERILASINVGDSEADKSGARRPLIIGIAVGLVVVLLGVIYLLGSEDEANSAKPVVVASEAIALPASDVYGFNRADREHSDKVDFSFRHNDGEVRIHFMVGDIAHDDEIEIKVNGHLVGYAPLATKRWTNLLTLDVPGEFIRRGQKNIVTFDNTRNPPGHYSWGVKNVAVSTFFYPNCDRDEAKKYTELGDNRYEDRSVHVRNLYDSTQYYRKALSYLIQCEGGEAERARVQERLDLADNHLNRMFDEHIFAGTQFMQLNDLSSAKEELLQARDLIGDNKDFRYEKAIDYLVKLSQVK